MENLWSLTTSENDLREYECETSHGMMYVRFYRTHSGIYHAEICTGKSRTYIMLTVTHVAGKKEDIRWVNPTLVDLLKEHRAELSLLPDDEILKLIDLPKLVDELGVD